METGLNFLFNQFFVQFFGGRAGFCWFQKKRTAIQSGAGVLWEDTRWDWTSFCRHLKRLNAALNGHPFWGGNDWGRQQGWPWPLFLKNKTKRGIGQPSDQPGSILPAQFHAYVRPSPTAPFKKKGKKVGLRLAWNHTWKTNSGREHAAGGATGGLHGPTMCGTPGQLPLLTPPPQVCQVFKLLLSVPILQAECGVWRSRDVSIQTTGLLEEWGAMTTIRTLQGRYS